MAAKAQSAEAIVRACVAAFNRCTSEWVDTYYAEDVTWLEQPSQAFPDGRRGGRGALYAAVEQARALFPNRQLSILNLVSEDSQVAAELEWQGTAARALGALQPGTTVRTRIASFFTVSEERIVKHTDYCVPVARA